MDLEIRLFFSYFFVFLTLFYIFYINEHLVVLFVELASGESRVSHLRSFCLHRITCLSIPMVTQA